MAVAVAAPGERRRAAAAALPRERRPRGPRGAGGALDAAGPPAGLTLSPLRRAVDDLAQVACLGLLKAIDRYDPEVGTGFTRYALPTMLGELKRHFRDKGWAVRVPRATQELALKVNDALGTLPAKLGRAARPRDVAEAIGVSVEEVLEAMEAATAYEATSWTRRGAPATRTRSGPRAARSGTRTRATSSSS